MEMLPFYLLHYPEFDNNKSKVVLKNGKEKSVPAFFHRKKDTRIIKGYRAFGSPHIITLPTQITTDLAYITGTIFGDGSISNPVKRKRGGYHWKIDITCELKYVQIISKIVQKIFNYKPIISKDKRKNDCWHAYINSIIIHRYFNRVIGIPSGPKTGNLPWLKKFCTSKEIFKYFLAGLTDTDGYVSIQYLAIIQKDKEFLEKLKLKVYNLLNIKFRGPYVNRKIKDKIVGWWIILSGKENIKKFMDKVPLKYKLVSMPP